MNLLGHSDWPTPIAFPPWKPVPGGHYLLAEDRFAFVLIALLLFVSSDPLTVVSPLRSL